MHPFLRSPGSFLLMGLFWSPIVLCVILLQSRLSGQPFSQAVALLGPLLIIELFICLSVWFPCKTIAIDRFSLFHAILRHALSALLMTSLWLLSGVLYSEILEDLTGDFHWRDMYDQAVPLLLATGLFLYFMFSLIYTMVLALEKGKKAEQTALENQVWAQSAELSSLKASIHPHFLFNSLNSVSMLTQKDPEMAYRISLRLADFLRYSLNYGKKSWVRVRDELEHIENFLGIEKTRLENRMELRILAAPDSLEEWLPPFTLLPLVENAVKHGFHASLDSGMLTLSVQRNESYLNIEVENPFEKSVRASKGEGFGLSGLMQRLSAVYVGEAELTTEQKNRTFRVRLRLPLIKGGSSSG